MKEEARVLACNLIEANKIAARGARAYLITWPNIESAEVLVRSRGGRWVRLWVRMRILGLFRPVTVTETAPRWDLLLYAARDEGALERSAAALNELAQSMRIGCEIDAETLQRIRRGEPRTSP